MSFQVEPPSPQHDTELHPFLQAEIDEYPGSNSLSSQPLPKYLSEAEKPDGRAVALIEYITNGGVHGDTRLFCGGTAVSAMAEIYILAEYINLADPEPQWVICAHTCGVYSARLEVYPEDINTELYFGVFDRRQITNILSHFIAAGLIISDADRIFNL